MARQAAPHVTASLRYARGVVAGGIPACQWVKLACQRQLDDIAREKRADWPFSFNREQAERVCRFMEKLPHVKGRWTGQQQELQPWQSFIVTTLFGWVNKKNGLRRFREAYIRVPRKNGKSLLAADIGLWMLGPDGELGAEVYSGATTEKQAWEVFGPARQMAQKTPGYCEKYGVEVNAKALSVAGTMARFQPVIGKPGDGASPHCAIVDEFHEHDTADQYETMVTGQGARSQPLTFIITTAGSNLAGPCYEKDLQAQKVLNGTIENERLFALIYGIDDGDDWADFASWKKANPNLGVSINEDYLKEQWTAALQNASRQNILKTKHLDEWCNARSAWMNMHEWELCKDPTLTPESVSEHPLYVGLDLASKRDLAARVSVFTALVKDGPQGDDESEAEDKAQPAPAGAAIPRGYRRHYWAFCKAYAPEAQAHDQKNTHYSGWEHQDTLIVTPGNEIDLGRIEDDIRDDIMGKFDLREVDFDPWHANSIEQSLAAEGVVCTEVPAQVKNFSPAMKEISSAVVAGRFHHDGNPVFTWFISNIVAREDHKGEIYPNKESKDSPQKIDGGVALIMAVSRAMVGDVRSPNSYGEGYFQPNPEHGRKGGGSYDADYFGEGGK